MNTIYTHHELENRCVSGIIVNANPAVPEKHRLKRLERLFRRNLKTMRTFQTFFRGHCTTQLIANNE